MSVLEEEAPIVEEYVPESTDPETAAVVTEFEKEGAELGTYDNEEERARRYVEMVMGPADPEDYDGYPYDDEDE